MTILCIECEQHSIPEKTFIDFYSDLLLLQNRTLSNRNDSSDIDTNNKKVRLLLDKYRISKLEVLKLVNEYNQHPTQWKQIFDSVSIRLEKKRMEKISQGNSQFK